MEKKVKNIYRKIDGEETYFKFEPNGQGIQISFSDHAAMITHVVYSKELDAKLVAAYLNEWRNALLKVHYMIGKLPDASRAGTVKTHLKYGNRITHPVD